MYSYVDFNATPKLCYPSSKACNHKKRDYDATIFTTIFIFNYSGKQENNKLDYGTIIFIINYSGKHKTVRNVTKILLYL